ncbi:MAG TPA: alanine racemase, partial [Solirubrobacteraceae bacterium]|nr:alanine racemase [Solirubrobacteraceae bacterium]
MPLRAVVAVNVAAIERNVARLARELQRHCRMCVVVKAEGYGHGAVASARAARAGGAGWLAVATAGEAAALRGAGIDGRLLVMGSLGALELDQALAAGADVVAWTERFVGAVAAHGGGRVHVKLDTGMGRLGTRDPDQATRTVEAAAGAPAVELVGAMTHFATADERGDAFFAEQLQR